MCRLDDTPKKKYTTFVFTNLWTFTYTSMHLTVHIYLYATDLQLLLLTARADISLCTHKHAQSHMHNVNILVLLTQVIGALWSMWALHRRLLSVCRVTQTEQQPRDTVNNTWYLYFPLTVTPDIQLFLQIEQNFFTVSFCPDRSTCEWHEAHFCFGYVLLWEPCTQTLSLI